MRSKESLAWRDGSFHGSAVVLSKTDANLTPKTLQLSNSMKMRMYIINNPREPQFYNSVKQPEVSDRPFGNGAEFKLN